MQNEKETSYFSITDFEPLFRLIDKHIEEAPTLDAFYALQVLKAEVEEWQDFNDQALAAHGSEMDC